MLGQPEILLAIIFTLRYEWMARKRMRSIILRILENDFSKNLCSQSLVPQIMLSSLSLFQNRWSIDKEEYDAVFSNQSHWWNSGQKITAVPLAARDGDIIILRSYSPRGEALVRSIHALPETHSSRRRNSRPRQETSRPCLKNVNVSKRRFFFRQAASNCLVWRKNLSPLTYFQFSNKA